VSQQNSEIQAEVQALQTVLSALAQLDDATRRRVLEYAHLRFGVAGVKESVVQPPMGLPPESGPPTESAAPTVITDVRTLRDQKQPKSAVEMAVLVAYYLSEVAGSDERKSTIKTADITKYFKQGDYPLPSQPRVILHRAKNAGYLDSSGRAQYKLNPVGHNLVAHGLPRSGTERPSAGRRAKVVAKTQKKAAAAKSKTTKATSRRKPKPPRTKR